MFHQEIQPSWRRFVSRKFCRSCWSCCGNKTHSLSVAYCLKESRKITDKMKHSGGVSCCAKQTDTSINAHDGAGRLHRRWPSLCFNSAHKHKSSLSLHKTTKVHEEELIIRTAGWWVEPVRGQSSSPRGSVRNQIFIFVGAFVAVWERHLSLGFRSTNSNVICNFNMSWSEIVYLPSWDDMFDFMTALWQDLMVYNNFRHASFYIWHHI